MKIEGIIIDGKKYFPIESKQCVECSFHKKDCEIFPGNFVCLLFEGKALKSVIEIDNNKIDNGNTRNKD